MQSLTPSSPQPSTPPQSVSDALIYESWRRGRLRWLLRPYQLEAYDAYRTWENLDPSRSIGRYGRIFNLDVTRRWGKSTFSTLIRIEDGLRNPGRVYRSVTAFQKDIEEIVDDIARVLLDSCPQEFRPVFKLSSGAQSAGFYFPHNSSVLKLAGLDKNPNALRGRASDGDNASEAAYIPKLITSIDNVLYAQYQGRPWARMLVESSAPDGPDTEYDKIIVADAKLRGAYYHATIDDISTMKESERAEFIRAAGGRESTTCRREYYCERVRDETLALVPEFDPAKHVRDVEMPKYADCYTLGDPGTADLFGLVFCYWHYELQKLIVVDSWAEYNAGNHKVATVVREREALLWGVERVVIRDVKTGMVERVDETLSDVATLTWHKDKLVPAPHTRVSDTDLRFVQAMQEEHGILFDLASKNDIVLDGRHEGTLQTLRNWVKDDRILFLPTCGPVLDHMTHGKWNAARSDWERHPAYGHYDCLSALRYGPRHIERNRNPNPPEWFLDAGKVRLVHHIDEHRTRAQLPSKTIEGMNRLYPKPAWRK